MRLHRILLFAGIALSISALIRTAYCSGRYVGAVTMMADAIDHHCGYIDPNGFHWRKPLTVDPSYYEIDDTGRLKPLMY